MIDIAHFATPDYYSVAIGSIVWYLRTDVLIGPLLVIGNRFPGYGRDLTSRRKFLLYDTSTGDYHQSVVKYLLVPKEIT